MKSIPLPPQRMLVGILDYSPELGILTWRYRADMPDIWNRKCAGKLAGTKNKKGFAVFVNNRAYQASRLIWMMVYSEDPGTFEVDHADCDCFNNKLENLRLATHGQNGSNSRGWRKKDLPKGVSLAAQGGFRVRIGIGGKVVHLGTYLDLETAHAAYCAAAVKVKGEFARAK